MTGCSLSFLLLRISFDVLFQSLHVAVVFYSFRLGYKQLIGGQSTKLILPHHTHTRTKMFLTESFSIPTILLHFTDSNIIVLIDSLLMLLIPSVCIQGQFYFTACGCPHLLSDYFKIVKYVYLLILLGVRKNKLNQSVLSTDRRVMKILLWDS